LVCSPAVSGDPSPAGRLYNLSEHTWQGACCGPVHSTAITQLSRDDWQCCCSIILMQYVELEDISQIDLPEILGLSQFTSGWGSLKTSNWNVLSCSILIFFLQLKAMGQILWVTPTTTVKVSTFGQIRLREALSPVSQSVFIIICRRGPCKKDYHPTSILSWIVIWNDNIIVRMNRQEVAWSQSLKQPDELLKGGDVFQVGAGGNKIHIALSLAHKHATACLGAL